MDGCLPVREEGRGGWESPHCWSGIRRGRGRERGSERELSGRGREGGGITVGTEDEGGLTEEREEERGREGSRGTLPDEGWERVRVRERGRERGRVWG